MKIYLAKVRVIRHTYGILGAALLLCHCGTGSVAYVNGATTAPSQTTNTTNSAAPTMPAVAGLTSSVMFDAASATGASHPATDTAYYTQTATTLAGLVTGAGPGAVIEVGKNQDGTCVLGFPMPQDAPADLSGNISFADTDSFEALLTALDALNAKVVLEVEPGYAPAGQLATVVMAAYGQHTSVVGFGINVAHNGVAQASDTASLSDAAADYVVGLVQTNNAAAQVYLRGSNTSMLPPTARDSLVFVDDANGFASQADQLTQMQSWASTYAPASVAYTIGAAADATWWCAGDNNHVAASLVAGLLSAPPSNLSAIFWSADSLSAVFPTQACTTLTAATSDAAAASSTPASSDANN